MKQLNKSTDRSERITNLMGDRSGQLAQHSQAVILVSGLLNQLVIGDFFERKQITALHLLSAA
ncbi:hypothetical protein D3C75_1157240 [compost metagenome]